MYYSYLIYSIYIHTYNIHISVYLCVLNFLQRAFYIFFFFFALLAYQPFFNTS